MSMVSPILALRDDLRGLVRLLAHTIHYTLHGKREKGALVAQMYAIGNRSAFFLSVSMGFIGMIMVFQSGMQAAHVVPDYTMLGPFYIKMLVRDLAASIGAMPLATRVGAGIAAELGTMKVTDQIDALRMCSAEPIDYLLVPRFWASVVMSLVLLVWAGFVALMAGMFTAHAVFDVNYHTFVDFRMVSIGDLVTGVAKCLAYGAAIPIVSAYRGFNAFGGAEGVGRATTDAVVHSTLAIILLNFFLSGVGYFVFPE
ncbi:MAG: ABC transporter permease [Sandaracinaceae bacterium]|jgi:phospholipid/cholesterol/gamma-HCH transport system permease protein|nr:ABC transporter permease [Sandaracinaceae bacterium]